MKHRIPPGYLSVPTGKQALVHTCVFLVCDWLLYLYGWIGADGFVHGLYFAVGMLAWSALALTVGWVAGPWPKQGGL